MTTTQSLRADWIAIAAGGGALALIMGALGFQYLIGLAPCEMCHWQRWPHIAAAIIGIIGGGFLPRRYSFYLVTVVIVMELISGGIGLYQTGMQYHVLPGPMACSADHPYVLGSNMAVQVRCDIPTWFFLGLALPAWNAILSFLIAGLATFAVTRKSNAA